MATREWFRAEEVLDWTGFGLLAEVCQEARLTARQGHVVLLHFRGFDFGEVQRLLAIPRKEVWRSRRAANKRLEATFPRLRELIDCLRLLDRDGRTEDAKAILAAIKGPRRSSGRTVQVGAADDYGRQLELGARSPVIGLEDVIDLYLSPMDLLPVLLEELLEDRKRKKR